MQEEFLDRATSRFYAQTQPKGKGFPSTKTVLQCKAHDTSCGRDAQALGQIGFVEFHRFLAEAEGSRDLAVLRPSEVRRRIRSCRLVSRGWLGSVGFWGSAAGSCCRSAFAWRTCKRVLSSSAARAARRVCARSNVWRNVMSLSVMFCKRFAGIIGQIVIGHSYLNGSSAFWKASDAFASFCKDSTLFGFTCGTVRRESSS